jgi:oxygen-independent coproporphyrinogen-3 oxidase
LFQQRTGLSLQSIHKGIAAATQKGLITQNPKRIKPSALGQRYLNDLLALFLN